MAMVKLQKDVPSTIFQNFCSSIKFIWGYNLNYFYGIFREENFYVLDLLSYIVLPISFFLVMVEENQTKFSVMTKKSHHFIQGNRTKEIYEVAKQDA